MQERVRIVLKMAVNAADPKAYFKRLGGSLHGLWKRREGHVRLIVHIDRGRMRVLILKIGRRDDVYEIDKAALKRCERDTGAA